LKSHAFPSKWFYPITETDTCRKYVLPKLYEADWTDEQISEQKVDVLRMLQAETPRNLTYYFPPSLMGHSRENWGFFTLHNRIDHYTPSIIHILLPNREIKDFRSLMVQSQSAPG
jgi:hypothetical protein